MLGRDLLARIPAGGGGAGLGFDGWDGMCGLGAIWGCDVIG